MTVDKLSPNELGHVYLYCTLRTDSEFQQLDLGIGNNTLQKAMKTCSGRDLKTIKASITEIGDYGKVIESYKAGQSKLSNIFAKTVKKNRLTFDYVFRLMRSIAGLSGTGANTTKEKWIGELLIDATALESRFITRFFLTNWRMGSAEKFFQNSLARAFLIKAITAKNEGKDKKFVSTENTEELNRWEKGLQRVLSQYPYHVKVIESLQKVDDIDDVLPDCHLSVGIPCKPMLAKPTKDIAIIFKRFENMPFTCEFKYDGLRGQIHYKNGDVNIFSRNLENMTQQYPDIIENLNNCIDKKNIESLIIDAEIVGFDLKSGRILPFQTLMTRNKKNVTSNNIEIQVCIFVFDMIFLNGESLLQKSLQARRDTLFASINEIEGKVKYVKYQNTHEVDEIQELLNESVKIGCEGLMLKTLETNSTYEPCMRSFKWLKMKRDYLESSLGDSLDLVPIGAKFGEGKRTGFYGGF